MEKKYYIVENNQPAGPLSLEEIKERNITRNTLIWYNGIKEWIKAEEVLELNNLFITPPPVNIKEEESSKIPPIPINKMAISGEFELASIGERFGGYLLISIITIVLYFAFDETGEELGSSNGFFLDILYAGISSGIMNGIFYPFFSGNLGHKLLGLKVIYAETGYPVNNIFYGFSREFLKGALTLIIIPVIWLFFDEKRQNLYDKMEGTLVVRNKK